MTAQASKSKLVPLLSVSGMFLAVNATLPVQAQGVLTYDITATWYEPMTQPENSIFVGSFDYNPSTHAVTDLQGQLSEAMTGPGVNPYNPATGPGVSDGMTWLTLNNQLPNGGASQQYEQIDPTLSHGPINGTLATVFLQNTSVTFNGGDGWSPQAGIAAGWQYVKNAPNAYAQIFVPDNLSAVSSTLLAWNESSHTGSLGLAYTSYADATPGGYMGSIGMAGTSAYAYGNVGSMQGVPYSEIITPVTSVPEPSSLALWAMSAPVLAALRFTRKKLRKINS
jgi:hypothetical protein